MEFRRFLRRSFSYWGFALALGLLASCASAPPPEVPYAQSEAYRKVRNQVAAYFERDLDGDTQPEVIAAQRIGPGFAPVIFSRELKDEAWIWRRGCQGPVVKGDEIQSMQWVEVSGRELLYVLATSRDPDTIEQVLALVDITDDCTEKFVAKVRIPTPDSLMVMPAELKVGIAPGGDGLGVRILDSPGYLSLAGEEGDVKLLRELRERIVGGSIDSLRTKDRKIPLLTAVELDASWQLKDGIPDDVSALVDGDDATMLVARAGETGHLTLAAKRPILLLEVHHGCPEGGDEPLHLVKDQSHYVSGMRPGKGEFVLGSGKGFVTKAGRRRDLILLRGEVTELRLRVGPEDANRCIRQLKGYAFREGMTPRTTDMQIHLPPEKPSPPKPSEDPPEPGEEKL